NLALTTLRPGPIYGPGPSRLNERYRQWLRQRVAVLPTLAFPHVHVADCAEAAVRALRSESARGQAYNLAGPEASPYAVVGARRVARGGGRRRGRRWLRAWRGLDARKVGGLLGRRLRRVEEHCTDLLVADARRRSVGELYSGLQSPAGPP